MNAAAFNAHSTANRQNPTAKNCCSAASPVAMENVLTPQQNTKAALAARLPDNAQSVKHSQITFPAMHAALSRGVRLLNTSSGNSHNDQIAVKATTDSVNVPRLGVRS
jgi:hypothetical protein